MRSRKQIFSDGAIEVVGAREHNLKNISVSLPRQRLVVISGVSGSGKSTLAFDTIFAEGQRRYVESLSAYARQFLGQMVKPAVDSVTGLSPAVAIDQKTRSSNPRSTVGTTTELWDYLRVLWARIGKMHCVSCAWEGQLEAATIPQMVDAVLAGFDAGTRVMVLAPLVDGRKGAHQEVLSGLETSGYTRVRVNGEVMELSEVSLDKKKKHAIECVVDRLVVKETSRNRLAESIETALGLSPESVVVATLEGRELFLSATLRCPQCGTGYSEPEPKSFSFNSPYGACESCAGLGTQWDVDMVACVPDDALSINEGAIAPWRASRSGGWATEVLRRIGKNANIDPDVPWSLLPAATKKAILGGSDKVYKVSGWGRTLHLRIEGVGPWVLRRNQEASDAGRARLSRYLQVVPCNACQGKRLQSAAAGVTVGQISIMDAAALPIDELAEFLTNVHLSDRDRYIAEDLIREILARLGFLVDVGLPYLSLDRHAGSLSGGESQRIRLASQIGSGLVGVLYVLDEPSIGLHPRDNQKLLDSLVALRELGNTVVVVEHDETTLRAADWLVDIGPGAGEAGGEVVAQGTPAQVCQNSKSPTGRWLSGKDSLHVPVVRRSGNGSVLRVTNARAHNLKNLTVDIPLGCLVAVTGVSGSGKSTLIGDILEPALVRSLGGVAPQPLEHDNVVGVDAIDKIINIDQTPIGRTPRSNAATYVGVFDKIRTLFANTAFAQERGWRPGRFSFNVPAQNGGGRCEACQGEGETKIEMHFLADVWVPCEVCAGTRYDDITLQAKFKDHSIADVLALTVSQALELFKNQAPIARQIQTLQDVGLGYLRLGQSATTLSGGEAQRVKLSSELQKRSTGKTLYILDEPTTGLHMADVAKLVSVLDRLVDAGNSVIVIEHNTDVMKRADWLLDLGPEGGIGGGTLVGEGTPEHIATLPTYTGVALCDVLSKD